MRPWRACNSDSSVPVRQRECRTAVRNVFVEETDRYRTRSARTAPTVVIDAYIHTVQARLAQLDRALDDAGKPAVGPLERIARLVPKRNVETWILSLNGKATGETTDYKGTVRDWNPLIRSASTTLNDLVRSGAELTGDYSDSLQAWNSVQHRLVVEVESDRP